MPVSDINRPRADDAESAVLEYYCGVLIDANAEHTGIFRNSADQPFDAGALREVLIG